MDLASTSDQGRRLVRFAHSADWQLGMRLPFGKQESQALFSEARLAAVRRLGEVCEQQRCAFALVCGDVFESNHLDRRQVARALESMQRIPVPVYLLPGNHDPVDPASVYRSAVFTRACPANVHVLDGPGPFPVAPGTRLVAGPWTSRRPTDNALHPALAADASAGLCIAAGHGAVDARSPDPSDPALIRLADAERAIREGRVHYVALGDHHSAASVGTTGRIRYPGTPEATDFGEDRPGYVLVVELDEADIRVTEVAVGRWRFVAQHFPLNGPADLDAMAEWLASQPDKEATVLKLSFVGTLTMRDRSRLDELMEIAGDLFAAVNTWERHTDLAVQPDELDLSRFTLGGFAAAAQAELRAAATDGDPAALDALALLYRLAGAPS